MPQLNILLLFLYLTLYATEILRRLALHGLVHCDFNEFNLMVDQEGQVTLIDFPQVRAVRASTACEDGDGRGWIEGEREVGG